MLSRSGRRQVSDSSELQPYSEMQKSMMDELDKRRHDWENEMQRMQEDFFKVRLAKPRPQAGGYSNNNNDQQMALPATHQYNNVTAVHLQSSQPQYIPADDAADGGDNDGDTESKMLCRWQFDVSGYDPRDINVSVDGGKLLVSARHADVKDVDNSSSSQLSKQTDIPRDVMTQQMTSYMTRDGLLVVQAPVIRSGHLTSGVKMAAVNGDNQQSSVECHFRPIDLPPQQPPSDDVIAASRRHVVKTDDGDELLKIVLDLGRSDYHPDDVSVQLSTNKVLVRVKHDESPPSGVKHSVHREISRDIDVPDTVYAPSMRVVLAPDGRLWIGASLTTNKDHRRVVSYIVQMMPRHSQRCSRVSQLYAITN